VLLGVVFVVMLTVDLRATLSLMLGEHATDAVAQLRDHLGLDKPFLVRYLDYVGRLARGDLGRSIQPEPPGGRGADAWPATLQLTIAALVIASVAGIARRAWLGGVAELALRRARPPRLAVGFDADLLDRPGAHRDLLYGSTGCRGRRRLALPSGPAAVSWPSSVAMIARVTRSAVLDVLREDYVRTARAKGVGELWVLGGHALRNAFIPIVTLLGLQSGQLMGGAVLTETVFAWPGLGRLMVKAIFARDYILLQGGVLVFALAFVIVNLLVDLSYGLLDPRIARQG
jgi:peptide/nickel transport system permease protein